MFRLPEFQFSGIDRRRTKYIVAGAGGSANIYESLERQDHQKETITKQPANAIGTHDNFDQSSPRLKAGAEDAPHPIRGLVKVEYAKIRLRNPSMQIPSQTSLSTDAAQRGKFRSVRSGRGALEGSYLPGLPVKRRISRLL